MNEAATAARKDDQPTEACPERGEVSLFEGVATFPAEHWLEEDGTHVLRSLEFDVIAGGATLEEAMAAFHDKARDLWVHLGELEEVTEGENELFVAVARRWHAVFAELQRREAERIQMERRRRLINFQFKRARERHFQHWRTSSAPLHSSLRSRA